MPIKWYEVQHPWPERVGSTVYGMPEFFADSIRDADIVANPGCYPTTAILPLVPLLEAGLITTEDIIIDGKSGVSGAGRSAKITLIAKQMTISIAVGCHRHQPEIDDIVRRVSGKSIQSLFTPHLSDRSWNSLHLRSTNLQGRKQHHGMLAGSIQNSPSPIQSPICLQQSMLQEQPCADVCSNRRFTGHSRPRSIIAKGQAGRVKT